MLPASAIVTFRIAPDDRRVAMARVDAVTNTTDVWIADVERAALTRLTLHPSNDLSPVWSRDGTRIVFRSDRTGDNLLFGRSSTGAGDDEQLTSVNAANPTDVSADGGTIMFHQSVAVTNTDIGIIPPAKDTAPTYVISTPFDEYDGRFSPDGKWVSYVSDESGRPEVYVQTFPVTGNKWVVSTNGGAEPRWRGDGRELFYVANDGKLMAVDIGTGAGFVASTPKALFQTTVRPSSNPFHVWMDARSDGQRFLIKRTADAFGVSGLTVVLNWPALTTPER
jgi:Tol biopolymer transport system component